MSRYVPISMNDMTECMTAMGFALVVDARCREAVFERPVTTKSGVEHPYVIRVYSSVLHSTGWSDECGADAIRVVLIDSVTGRPAKKSEKRVHRTKNALPNLTERCRDAFRYVLVNPACPKCTAMMVERENCKTGGKFWSCSRYSPGRDHHCNGTRPHSG